MDEREKLEKDVVNEVDETVEESKEEVIKPIITSRVLFVSILDKLFLIGFAFSLIMAVLSNFLGDLSSMQYDYWGRALRAIGLFIVFVVVGLILNYLYKCVAKTMLCLTDKQVYQEIYFPFVDFKSTIPLEKITKVSTYNVLWIFRCIIIFQYMQLPLVFFTWNNKEFKKELIARLNIESTQVKNEWENKNIITSTQIKILALVSAAIVVLTGIFALIGNLTAEERKVIGYFADEEHSVTIEKDGDCSVVNLGESNGKNYEWTYNKNTDILEIRYETTERRYSSYYYSSSYYDETHWLSFKFDSKEKTLTTNDVVLKKTRPEKVK